jgi:hypothetical protein
MKQSQEAFCALKGTIVSLNPTHSQFSNEFGIKACIFLSQFSQCHQLLSKPTFNLLILIILYF